MNSIIPILPCVSIKEQVAFFESLGFEPVKVYTSPNPYAVIKYDTMEIHFWGSRKVVPNENASMCAIKVDDVDKIYEVFTSNFKQKHGKIPRSGMPRISKLKDLSADRRFNITDISGNTFFVLTPNTELSQDNSFFRTIENKEYSKNFELLYHLIYSKEDVEVALNMLKKHFPSDLTSLKVSKLDLAKILLVVLEINLQKNNKEDKAISSKIKELYSSYKTQSSDWKKIIQKYDEIVSDEQ